MIEILNPETASLVSAFIVAFFALVGTIVSAKFVSNVRVVKLEMKMMELESKVTKHNRLVERTYELEKNIALLEKRLHGISKS